MISPKKDFVFYSHKYQHKNFLLNILIYYMNKFFVIIIYLLLFRLILSLTFIWVGPLYSSAGMQRKLMIFLLSFSPLR